ncbi:LON peptidase substrate-binding domain-containing protein [Gephyromycinifex aptenodytis]|uniref:LON peptidase substrate-binding domain-containing protein n=1 Tax=Gephyromycinifex aptenodytis TaxID=2716227 RepID=UPI0014481133|nr:LON peptidase substrate-binding domain-containing protein [Gephyromycinifex aptenodytis]
MAQLPLFPLGTVLLPGGPLPLRVFEPRYIEMLREVLNSEERQFGVIAVRQERADGAWIPNLHRVGCAARVESVRRIEGGAFGIIVRGTNRFVLDRVDSTQAPYLIGEVWWPDLESETPAGAGTTLTDPGTRIQAATGTLSRLAHTYAAALNKELELAEEPAQVCHQILELLGLPLGERQQVLEAGDEACRLDYLTGLLTHEVTLSRSFGPLAPFLTDRPHSN